MPDSERQRRAAAQPRDRRPPIRPARCSSRSPPSPRWRTAPVTPDPDRSSTTASFSTATGSSRTPRRQLRADQHVAGAEGVLGRLLLHARRAGQRQGPDHPARGPSGSGSATARDRPARRVRRPGARTGAGATRRTRSTRSAREKAAGPGRRRAVACGGYRAAVVGGRQRQPRGRPGRPAGDPAADGDRLRDDGQRRHVVTPHLAKASRTATASRSRSSAPRRARRSSSTSETARSSSTACTRRDHRGAAAPPRTCSRAGRRNYPVYGKTGTVERPGPRPVVVRRLRARPQPPHRRRGHRREGWLRRRRPRRPAARLILSNGSTWATTSSTPGNSPRDERLVHIQPASDPPPPLVPREWRLRLDPLLLLATLGLVACSLIAIKGATRRRRTGPAYTTSSARRVYAGVGLVLMYAVSRLDYSRAARAQLVSYGLLIGSILVSSFALATNAARKRWIETAGLAASRRSWASSCFDGRSPSRLFTRRAPQMREMGRQTRRG